MVKSNKDAHYASMFSPNEREQWRCRGLLIEILNFDPFVTVKTEGSNWWLLYSLCTVGEKIVYEEDPQMGPANLS